jgi:Berberine and berberine like
MAAYRDPIESAPRELTAAVIVRLAPQAPLVPAEWHGKPIAGILCHTGANPAADLAALRALGDLAGARNEHGGDDGAVGNRDARRPAAAHVAWVQEGWERIRIRPFSTGGNYVNMQTADDDTARTADAYRNNHQRLQRVKATYDPDNLFRVNRNIPRQPSRGTCPCESPGPWPGRRARP